MNMTKEQWLTVEEAYRYLIMNSGVKRVDNDDWALYRVGSNIIRLDIKVKS